MPRRTISGKTAVVSAAAVDLVLGLDVAPTASGIVRLWRDGRAEGRTWKRPKTPAPGAALHAWRVAVEALIDRAAEPPALVVVEAPFFAFRANQTTAAQWRQTIEMIAFAKAAAYALGVPYLEVAANTLKAFARGQSVPRLLRRPGEAVSKASMIAFARSCGFEPADDHQADGYWCARWGYHQAGVPWRPMTGSAAA